MSLKSERGSSSFVRSGSCSAQPGGDVQARAEGGGEGRGLARVVLKEGRLGVVRGLVLPGVGARALGGAPALAGPMGVRGGA